MWKLRQGIQGEDGNVMINHGNRKPREDAFTLVEMLVVIIIIGVLVAIAIPAFLNQRKAAYNAALKTDLRNMATVTDAWLLNHDAQNFYEITKGKEVIYLTGENSKIDYVLSKPEEINPSNWRSGADWKLVEDMSNASVSEASVVELVFRKNSNQDKYCLVGSNHMSNYNYVPGSGAQNGKADAYSRVLYYDSLFGGVHTI